MNTCTTIVIDFYFDFSLLDVNECLNEEHGQHNCHPDAYCTNTKGAFNCTCHHDFHNLYHGNGTHCEGMRLPLNDLYQVDRDCKVYHNINMKNENFSDIYDLRTVH